jgi:hypothetical protein
MAQGEAGKEEGEVSRLVPSRVCLRVESNMFSPHLAVLACRWSKAIDNRMSVISTNWNPGSSSDPRKSISSAANRRDQVGSVYSTFEGRPSQSSHLRDVSGQQEMSQTSFARPATSVFLASGEQRASRVSFAFADTPNNRVSFADGGDHSPGRKSFAASHGRGISQGQIQQRPSISIYDADGTRHTGSGGRGRRSEDMISPDQATGPHVLGEDDVEEELSSMAAVRSEFSLPPG